MENASNFLTAAGCDTGRHTAHHPPPRAMSGHAKPEMIETEERSQDKVFLLF